MSRATLEEAEVAARAVGRRIGECMPPGWGFVLLLSSFGEAGFSTYLCNQNREDTIKLLREMADKIERGEPEA